MIKYIPKELTITKHAIERYTERVLGYDQSKLTTKIYNYIYNNIKVCLPRNVLNGRYSLAIGGIAVVKNSTIVTIIK